MMWTLRRGRRRQDRSVRMILAPPRNIEEQSPFVGTSPRSMRRSGWARRATLPVSVCASVFETSSESEDFVRQDDRSGSTEHRVRAKGARATIYAHTRGKGARRLWARRRRCGAPKNAVLWGGVSRLGTGMHGWPGRKAEGLVPVPWWPVGAVLECVGGAGGLR